MPSPLKATTFTPEQQSALTALETALASHDLHAIGYNRKFHAHRSVAHWYKEVERLGIADALTASEMHQVNLSRSFIL